MSGFGRTSTERAEFSGTRLSMTVRYSLSRLEVASGYFYGWKYSSTFRRQMLLLALFVGGAALLSTYFQRHSLSPGDLVTALAWAGGALLAMPILLALRARTQERVMDLASDGIKTTIGHRRGMVPWSAVTFVRDSHAFVVIGGRNLNAFFVPNRAFADAAARRQFVADAQTWMQQRTS